MTSRLSKSLSFLLNISMLHKPVGSRLDAAVEGANQRESGMVLGKALTHDSKGFGQS